VLLQRAFSGVDRGSPRASGVSPIAASVVRAPGRTPECQRDNSGSSVPLMNTS
jgi:hypothetical protein